MPMVKKRHIAKFGRRGFNEIL